MILNVLNMRSVLFLFSGLFVGLYFSWPGILFSRNWECFNDIISKSKENKISLKAALEVSPSFLISGKNKHLPSKIRIVADACFR
tara:strand:+ start:188 stop:442 length:255 start_codon:yes stop_codon:yes gene_type:complete